MNSRISNRTSIGNTTNPALKVASLVAAFEIKEKTSFMHDDKKYSNKKGLSVSKSSSAIETAEYGL